MAIKAYAAVLRDAETGAILTERIYAPDYRIAKTILDDHLTDAHRTLPTLVQALALVCITDGGYAAEALVSRTLREYVRDYRESQQTCAVQREAVAQYALFGGE